MNAKTQQFLDELRSTFPFEDDGLGLKVNSRSIFNDTPLHVAARSGDLDLVLALLEDGAEIDAVGDYGKTPLHNAAQYGHRDLVVNLMALGAKADIPDSDCDTVIQMLSRAQRVAGTQET